MQNAANLFGTFKADLNLRKYQEKSSILLVSYAQPLFYAQLGCAYW
jgi:hypothetical protein